MNGSKLTRPLILAVIIYLFLNAAGKAHASEVVTLVAGRDTGCSRASDQKVCEAMKGCQAAFEDLESDLDTPIYFACIANPRQDDETLAHDDEESLEATSRNNCQGIADDHLYIKHVMETVADGDSKKVVTKRELKLKVCHQTGNMAAHTIITECPSLKSHDELHDDYLGACIRE